MRFCLPVLLILMFTTARAETTAERCKAYADRAVQQYQLLMSHPQCQANLDRLAWNGDFNYHFNGCRMLPAGMDKVADDARQNHLQSCGALAVESGASPANAAPPTAANTSAAVGVPAALVTPTPGTAVGCQMPGPLQQRLTKPVQGFGLLAGLNGGLLSYHDSPPVTPQTRDVATIADKANHGDYPIATWPAQRPKFFFTGCQGIPATSALGPWIGQSGHTWRYIFVSASGAIVWREISPEDSQAFLGR